MKDLTSHVISFAIALAFFFFMLLAFGFISLGCVSPGDTGPCVGNPCGYDTVKGGWCIPPDFDATQCGDMGK